MAQSSIDSTLGIVGLPKVTDLETLTYSLFAFYVLVPLFQLVKSRLTKDPVVEELRKLSVALTNYGKCSEEANASMLTSLEGIHEHQLQMIQKVHDSTKFGLSDEHLSVKTFHTSIQYSMLCMISLYHERVRKNNIKDRHLVLGRYHRGGSSVSGTLYVALNSHTCVINGRKLSGFLNNNGADLLFARISEELFDNHVRKANNGETELTEEDIEGALDRFSSIAIGCFKRWINNDKLTLTKQWDDIETKIRFILKSDEIEYLKDIPKRA